MKSATIGLLATVLAGLACGTATHPMESPEQRTGSLPVDPASGLAGQGAAAPDEPAGDPKFVPQPDETPPAKPAAAPDSNGNPAPSEPKPAAPADDPGDPPSDPGTAGSVWIGYIENHQFASGSDALTLTLDSLAATGVAGRIMFGMGPAGPPPDPHSVLSLFTPRAVHEAYDYAVRDASFDGKRLRFGVAPDDVWNDFCSSLPPIADEVNAGNFACTPNWAFTATGNEDPNGCYLTNPETGVNEQFDCAQYWFCNQVTGVCRCDAGACGTEDVASVRFDMVVDGDEINGSVVGIHNALNVHFKRQ